MFKPFSTMFRPIDCILIVLMLIAAGYTYNIKHQADLIDKNIDKLYAQIKFEKEKIDLLDADWALLNNVARLENLVERYQGQLQLNPLQAEQIISLNQLPPKRQNPIPALDDLNSVDLDSTDLDQLTTGSIKTNGSAQDTDSSANQLIENDVIESDYSSENGGN